MKKRLGCVCVMWLVCAGAGMAQEAAEDSRDDRGVSAMLTRLEKASGARDAAGALANFSDEAVALLVPDVTHPDGALFVTKKDLRRQVAEAFQRPRPEVRFVDCKAAVLPWPADVAYMLVTRATRAAGVKGMVDRHLMMAHHEGGRWRIFTSFPLFVELRVVVEKVQPGGAAAGVGMKAGDIIVRYAGRPVAHAEELQGLGRQIAQDPAFEGKPVPVEVRRGAERLCVKLPTGEPGVELSTRLEGEVDTQTLTGPAASKHAAAKPILDAYAAVRKGDAAAYAAAFCAGGFAMPFPAAEAGKTVIAHPGNVRALSGTLLKAVGGSMRAKTLQVREVCLIVRGTAALGGCRVAFERLDGTAGSVYDTWLLVKHKGTWGLAGIVPPTAGIRLGLGR